VVPLASNSPNALYPREAADALRSGAVVLIPTDTVFGLAADASSPDALRALWSISEDATPQPPQPLAWHIGTAAPLLEALSAAKISLSPIQKRLIDRLCPGPILLAIELPEPALATIRSHLGVEAGVIDNAQTLLVRITGHPDAQRFLEAAQRPVVVRALPGTGTPRTLDEAVRALERAGVASSVPAALTSESRPLGQPSTLLRFLSSGGYRVDREGAYAARYIDKQIMHTILFVCTGNTCRSPMAEAIARHLIEQLPLDLPTTVRSAGAFTSEGMPATPEAVVAVESLGVPMPHHASSVLTRELISQADEIYGLTASHLEAIRSIDPSASDKAKLLDPSGSDVPDPIGQGQSVYNTTAQRLRELIAQRFAEHRSASSKEHSR